MSKKNTPQMYYRQQKKRNQNKLILFIILLLLILLISIYNFFQLSQLSSISNINDHLGFFFIQNLNIIILTILGFLSIRYLVKIIYERKRSQFKGLSMNAKLTLIFCIFAIIPIVMLYLIVQNAIIQNLNYWFQGQYAHTFKQTAQIIDNFHQNSNEDIKILGKNLVILLDQTKSEKQNELLKTKAHEYPVQGIIMYDEKLNIISTVFKDASEQNIWEKLPAINIDQNKAFDHELFAQLHNNHFYYRNLFSSASDKNKGYLELFKSSKQITPELLSQSVLSLSSIKKTHYYDGLVYANYESYLLVFIFAVVFSSIWVAIYLSRQITKPLYALVDATKRVGKGDLDMPVDWESRNEFGFLVTSFNKMTSELKEKQTVLDHKQKELLENNLLLEENNAFIDQVLQNIKSAVLSFNNEGQIKAINQSMITNFQLVESYAVKKHYKEILSDPLVELIRDLEDDIHRKKQNHAQTSINLLINSNWRRFDSELFLLHDHKKEPLYLLVMHDLTNIDKKTRSKAWQEVARRIAHEIKNPLTPIRLSAERIIRKIDGIKEEKVINECLNTIINQVNSIKRMVEEFARFARLPEIEPQMKNINKIIETFILDYQTGYAECTIDFERDDQINDTMIDEDQIRRVFTNLFDNAIFAMPNEKRITVKTNLRKDKKIIIEVIDIGEGIATHLIDEIFEPYVTSKKEGVGLGLAIVGRIIADHNGFISIKNNTEQKGVIVSIELPNS